MTPKATMPYIRRSMLHACPMAESEPRLVEKSWTWTIFSDVSLKLLFSRPTPCHVQDNCVLASGEDMKIETEELTRRILANFWCENTWIEIQEWLRSRNQLVSE